MIEERSESFQSESISDTSRILDYRRGSKLTNNMKRFEETHLEQADEE